MRYIVCKEIFMINILLADDDENIREVLTFALENSLSCSVIQVASGNEAIDKLSSTDIDVIISDYRMGNGNGDDVYKFNVNNRDVPFCLLSGGDHEDNESFSGFNDNGQKNRFLMKPIDFSELVETVREITGQKA